MKTSKFRLTAYKAEPSVAGCVAVSVFEVKARKEVDCTLTELPAIATEYAAENKPCAVWIGVVGRKPNGFKNAKTEFVNL